jgi:biotin operon repressor
MLFPSSRVDRLRCILSDRVDHSIAALALQLECSRSAVTTAVQGLRARWGCVITTTHDRQFYRLLYQPSIGLPESTCEADRQQQVLCARELQRIRACGERYHNGKLIAKGGTPACGS